MRRIAELVVMVVALFLMSADFYDGAGIFGKWVLDKNGLVAYQYDMDQTSDPRAKWDRGGDETRLMWHQLGNLRINAIATNDGFVQLFYNDSAQRWLNYYDPKNLRYSGGFGFILDGETAFTSYYPYAPKEKYSLRMFGQGYFEKEMEHNQVLVNETIFAPEGDLPVLIMRVRIKNLSSQKKQIYYFAYFDVNPFEILPFSSSQANARAGAKIKFTPEIIPESSLCIARSQKIWSKDGGFPPKVMSRDPELPDIFLASLDGNAVSFPIDPEEIFSASGWKGASALKNLLIYEKAPAKAIPKISKNNFAMLGIAELELNPGEERVFNFAYGYAKAQKIEDLLSQISSPEKIFEKTLDFWKKIKPVLTIDRDQYLSRELEWNNYYLVSSFLYDSYYNRHFAPQGGHYLYVSGVHGATRDLAGFTLGLIYFQPELAREMLELCLENQEPSGRMFYDFEGYGKRYSIPFRPSDLSLWILWASTEYVFATRDFEFLKKELPYWPREKGEKGAVLEHLVRAYEHLQNDIGVGPRGLLQLRMSDWNDQMTLLVTRNDPIDFILTYFDGESVLNSTMACYILPNFSRLLRAVEQDKKAKQVDDFYSKLKDSLQKQWLDSGWFPRAYSALGKSFGKKEIFLEPQIWALLSEDLLTGAQQNLLMKNIQDKLRSPSKLGMLISSDTKGSLFAKPGEQERGGIWFAMNGPGAYALSKYAPEIGYDELKKNSLAWHAIQYPELWYGIWSGPDSFNSVFSNHPGATWLESKIAGGPSLFPVMNNNSHAQFLWPIARMAGFNPTSEGYLIHPLLPFENYKLETRLLGIEKSRDRIAGYFIFNTSGWMTLRVELPENFSEKITVLVAGRETIYNLENNFLKFPLAFEAGEKINWEVKKVVK